MTSSLPHVAAERGDGACLMCAVLLDEAMVAEEYLRKLEDADTKGEYWLTKALRARAMKRLQDFETHIQAHEEARDPDTQAAI